MYPEGGGCRYIPQCVETPYITTLTHLGGCTAQEQYVVPKTIPFNPKFVKSAGTNEKKSRKCRIRHQIKSVVVFSSVLWKLLVRHANVRFAVSAKYICSFVLFFSEMWHSGDQIRLYL